MALVEPFDALKSAEVDFDFTTRLAMLEELKSMPWQAVWDYYCMQQGVPVGLDWLDEVKKYEQDVLLKRG